MRGKWLVLAGVFVGSGMALPVRAEPQTTLVFFSEWSGLIDSDATAAIQHAADLAKVGSHKVHVVGYADTTGSETANKILSQLRSQVVTDTLVADGVSADAITQDAKGETPAPSDSKQESRRVSIVVE